MSNHPNRSRREEYVPAASPKPSQIVTARERAGMTQTEAAQLINSTLRSWQNWELGERPMHAALFEIFLRKLEELRGERHGLGRPTSPIEVTDPATGEDAIVGFGWQLADVNDGDGRRVEILMAPSGAVRVRYWSSEFSREGSHWFSTSQSAADWMQPNLVLEFASLASEATANATRRYVHFASESVLPVLPMFVHQSGTGVEAFQPFPDRPEPILSGRLNGYARGIYRPANISGVTEDGTRRYVFYVHDGMTEGRGDVSPMFPLTSHLQLNVLISKFNAGWRHSGGVRLEITPDGQLRRVVESRP